MTRNKRELEMMMNRLEVNLDLQREQFLSMVDRTERLRGKTPRTSEIREFWRKCGSPPMESADCIRAHLIEKGVINFQ